MKRKQEKKSKNYNHLRQPKRKAAQTSEESGQDDIGEEPEERKIFIFHLEDIQSTRTKTYGGIKTVSPTKKEIFHTNLQVPCVSPLDTSRFDQGKNGITVVYPINSTSQIEKVEHNFFSVSDITSSRTVYRNSITVVEPKDRMEKINLIIPSMDVTSIRIPTNTIMRSAETMLKERAKSEDKIELDEEDPFFNWKTGGAFVSRKPCIVINTDNEDGTALEMLKIMLRDAYTELVGGKPNAYTVEFIANEPRFNEISGNITVLDLSGDNWKTECSDSDVPKIKNNGVDIVPKISEIAQTLFTGKLGYLIINIPSSWEKSIYIKDKFTDILIRHLSRDKKEDQLHFFKCSLKTDCLTNLHRYWGLENENNMRPESVESVYDNMLYKNDWRRVFATKRQEKGNESDEHYFLKAAIVEGFLYFLYSRNREEIDMKYDDFVREKSKDIVETEEGNNEPIPDIIVKKKVEYGVRFNGFFKTPLDTGYDEIFIEVETGRSEGGFNFRKIRDKVDKYNGKNNGENNKDYEKLVIVIPPRLLFRGKTRAKMIFNLTRVNDPKEKNPTLAVPIFNKNRCVGLEKVNENYIDKLYGKEEKE